MSYNHRSQVDLDHTINSGQVFLWSKESRYWYGIHGDDIIRIERENSKITSLKHRTYDLFRDSDRPSRIYNLLSADPVLKLAISRFKGLRIIRQDPFQCTISFIVSSNSSILKIKKSLDQLCKKFGDKVVFDNKEFHTFPDPEDIAKASIRDLAQCGFGYRTAFVKNASDSILRKEISFEEIKKMPYSEAKKEIMKISGVGHKVSDCILLFSLENLEAFPLDRWMIRALQNHYSKKFHIETKTITPKQYELLHEKIVENFGQYSGYAQQFLFKMEREDNQKRWL